MPKKIKTLFGEEIVPDDQDSPAFALSPSRFLALAQDLTSKIEAAKPKEKTALEWIQKALRALAWAAENTKRGRIEFPYSLSQLKSKAQVELLITQKQFPPPNLRRRDLGMIQVWIEEHRKYHPPDAEPSGYDTAYENTRKANANQGNPDDPIKITPEDFSWIIVLVQHKVERGQSIAKEIAKRCKDHRLALQMGLHTQAIWNMARKCLRNIIDAHKKASETLSYPELKPIDPRPEDDPPENQQEGDSTSRPSRRPAPPVSAEREIVYRPYEPDVADTEGIPEELLALLVERAEVQRSDLVLDPMARNGEVLNYLRGRYNGIKVFAGDPLSKRREKLTAEGFSVMQTLEDDTFDKVISILPLNDVRGAIRLAMASFAALRYYGRLVVVAPTEAFENNGEFRVFASWRAENRASYSVAAGDPFVLRSGRKEPKPVVVRILTVDKQVH